MKFWCHFSKIYMRNNWFKIWYSYSNLVAFAIIETKSQKNEKKKKKTHNQECKKIIKGYLHFYIIKKIFSFLSRY